MMKISEKIDISLCFNNKDSEKRSFREVKRLDKFFFKEFKLIFSHFLYRNINLHVIRKSLLYIIVLRCKMSEYVRMRKNNLFNTVSKLFCVYRLCEFKK